MYVCYASGRELLLEILLEELFCKLWANSLVFCWPDLCHEL